MNQESFEQAILAVLCEVPKQRRMPILAMVQGLVKEHIHHKTPPTRPTYSVERHREIRKLTATIHGSLAEAISADRNERG
jgi:hypothetical protein